MSKLEFDFPTKKVHKSKLRTSFDECTETKNRPTYEPTVKKLAKKHPDKFKYYQEIDVSYRKTTDCIDFVFAENPNYDKTINREYLLSTIEEALKNLKENSYIPTTNPQPDDIAIYFRSSNHKVVHYGLIVRNNMLRHKIGQLDVFETKINIVPYKCNRVLFMRKVNQSSLSHIPCTQSLPI